MAPSTASSGRDGTARSKPARSTAPAATSSSSRARNGTSTTTTGTARSTSGRRTPPATGQPQHTEPSAGSGRPVRQRTARGTGEPFRPGLVAEAVLRDLQAIYKQAPELASSGLAAMAFSLAQSVDDPVSTTSKSMCAGRLLDTLEALRALVPEKAEGDVIDDFVARRAQRLARAAAAKA